MKNKKVFLIAGIILAAAVLLSIGVFAYSQSPQQRLKRQLSLGERYLNEKDYEQAIAAYTAAIEIEPKSEEAREGLSASYYGYAEMLVSEKEYEDALDAVKDALRNDPENAELLELRVRIYLEWGQAEADDEDFEEAIRILEEGYKKTKDERISELLEELKKEQTKQIVAAAAEEFCEKLAGYCAQEDYENAYHLLGTQEFADIVSTADNNHLENDLIVPTSHESVGIYPVKTESYGNYMVYCGEYSGEDRQGHGIWLGYNDGQYYVANGEWKADFPEGYQECREWNERLADSVVTRVIRGNTSEGLWDGSIIWSFELTDDYVKAWEVTFTKGSPVILYVEDEGTDDEHYVWSTEMTDGTESTLAGSEKDPTLGIEGFLLQ